MHHFGTTSRGPTTCAYCVTEALVLSRSFLNPPQNVSRSDTGTKLRLLSGLGDSARLVSVRDAGWALWSSTSCARRALRRRLLLVGCLEVYVSPLVSLRVSPEFHRSSDPSPWLGLGTSLRSHHALTRRLRALGSEWESDGYSRPGRWLLGCFPQFFMIRD